MNAYDVVVIGAGAAGLMCALTAGQRGARVLVIEHANKPGKKILMSGGGRCNFTNTGATPANYLSNNPHFCKSALARYTPAHFIELVDRHGIAWHEKELGQLFCDESSKQIVKLLLDECGDGEVQLEIGCAVQAISPPEAGFFRIETARGPVRAARLVIATGGLSIPSMGASGFGYAIGRQFGHQILPTRAGLVPLTLSGKPQAQLQDLSGVSLPVRASAGKAAFENAMLLTHRGLSGPSILQVSSYWQPGQPLRLDLLPGLDALEWLQAQQRTRASAELKTVLGEVLPRRFAQRLCEVWLPNRPMKQFNGPELKQMAQVLSHWPVVPSGTEGYRTAEVTLGGIDTDEVSSSSFESRLQPGLHFVGEVLDVTGWLGGYNFQWAWASGHAAGLAATS
jgi:predicted Rossmann fold flavoprotein